MSGMADWREAWRNLGARERRTVVAGGVMLLVMLGYTLLWSPFIQRLEGARGRVQTGLEDLAWMQSKAAEARGLQSVLGDGNQGSAGFSGTLAAFVEESLRRGGLGSAFKGVESSGNDQVVVKLEAAPFHSLVAWMIELHSKGVVVHTASLEREQELGKVRVRLVLGRSGG
ncbi:MAG: type II secretion system protein M [Magnetococcales bacterium]|nr:type II secretion system protein M [Magnetococcales bacterium]